jgi:translation elongation factor EF-Ts
MTSAPATANDVVRNLVDLTRELRDKTSAYRTAEHDAALKRHAANIAEARAFLSADGAMELRKHTARVAADRSEGDALVAEALVRILKAEIRSIETRIDVGRTYGATVRAELKTLDYSGAP